MLATAPRKEDLTILILYKGFESLRSIDLRAIDDRQYVMRLARSGAV
jgi:hypothetical protein